MTGCPWKLVTIVSKLLYSLLKGLTTYLCRGDLVHLLLVNLLPSRTSQSKPEKMQKKKTQGHTLRPFPTDQTFGGGQGFVTI